MNFLKFQNGFDRFFGKNKNLEQNSQTLVRLRRAQQTIIRISIAGITIFFSTFSKSL